MSLKACLKTTGVVATLVMGGAATAAAGIGTVTYYSQDLPTLETLENYRPPTVTVVYDNKGQVLGEIYEQRRYVVELDTIPGHVQEAFIAAATGPAVVSPSRTANTIWMSASRDSALDVGLIGTPRRGRG